MPAITPLSSPVDRLHAAGVAALQHRYSGLCGAPNQAAAAPPIGARRLVDIARLTAPSCALSPHASDDLVAEFLLSTSVNRSGDHPDLISAIASKALANGSAVADETYPLWCERIEDLQDFKSKNIVDTAVFQALDAIQEDEDPKQLKFDSTLQSWIRAGRFSNKVGLTVEMVVNDDLGGFLRQVRTMAIAARMTVSRACLDLLNANPTMPDGFAFFSSDHANVVSSGGGTPTSTQLQKHRLLHRTNTSYGTDLPMGLTLDRILVPAALEEIALQSCSVREEPKTPVTDATINTFRGSVRPIVDAHLDAYSTSLWYSFVDPMMASAIVYAFRPGYGPAGLEREWYDPARQTRYVAVETQFGVALNNWRAVVRNVGS